MINVEERKVTRKPKDPKVNDSKEEPPATANISSTTELEAYTKNTDTPKEQSPKEDTSLNASDAKQEEVKKEAQPFVVKPSILDCLTKNIKDVYQFLEEWDQYKSLYVCKKLAASFINYKKNKILSDFIENENQISEIRKKSQADDIESDKYKPFEYNEVLKQILISTTQTGDHSHIINCTLLQANLIIIWGAVNKIYNANQTNATAVFNNYIQSNVGDKPIGKYLIDNNLLCTNDVLMYKVESRHYEFLSSLTPQQYMDNPFLYAVANILCSVKAQFSLCTQSLSKDLRKAMFKSEDFNKQRSVLSNIYKKLNLEAAIEASHPN